MQHAWAEIEHDIQYKAAAIIPSEIRRRFMALAGLLEIADREFEAIQNADELLKETARENVEVGTLSNVEITPDSLKAFLNKKLGEDRRIGDISYEWTTRILKKLGFENLEQVQECTALFDDDNLSRIATDGRQGQTARFEFQLLAGLGEKYVERHLWAADPSFQETCRKILERFRSKGIEVGCYNFGLQTSSSEHKDEPMNAIPDSDNLVGEDYG